MTSSEREEPQPRLPPRMKILQIIQKNLATAGISPILSAQEYPLNAKILFGFLKLGLNFICFLIYTFFEAKTFTEYTQSIYMCSLTAFMFFVLLIIIWNVKKLFGLINGVESLVNTTFNYSESKRIFTQTIQFEEELSGKLIFFAQKMIPIICLIVWAIYIYFIYLTTDIGNAVFRLPAPMWLPFDWKNPIGFLIANSMQYIMFSYACIIAACAIALAIGLYLNAIAGSKCIKEILFVVSESAELKMERKHIRAQLVEFMQIHSRAKQLISDFSDIFEPIFALLFIWSLITICAAMLMIQVQMLHHGDTLTLVLVTTIQVSYAFGVMFAACELCQRLNLAFNECSEIFNQFKWYSFPVEIQRMLPTIIHFVQQPVEIKCFGTTAYDRETFKYVFKNAFSYFTVLREFYD